MLFFASAVGDVSFLPLTPGFADGLKFGCDCDCACDSTSDESDSILAFKKSAKPGLGRVESVFHTHRHACSSRIAKREKRRKKK